MQIRGQLKGLVIKGAEGGQLNDQEESALQGFLETLEAQRFDSKQKVKQEYLSRGPEGQIKEEVQFL